MAITQNGVLKRDDNDVPVMGGTSSSDNATIINSAFDPVTRRLLVDSAAGSGTVTSISQGTGILLSTNPLVTTGTVSLSTALQPIASLAGNALKVLRVNAGETAVEYATPGSGTVTTVSVATANGFSGTVANATTTPAITLTLGAITPTTVNGITLSGSGSIANSGTTSLTGFTGSGTSSGTNTGDQTSVSGNAGTVTVADAGGDTTTFPLLATDATGNLSPRTDAGLTYNANTNELTTTTFVGALTGTASGNLVSGGALGTPSSGTATNITGLPIDGGTTGTLPVNRGGTGDTTLTAHGVLIGEGTSAVAATAAGSAGQVLRSGGASADPSYSTATYPATAGTSGNVLTSDGTNWTSAAPAASSSKQLVQLAGQQIAVAASGTSYWSAMVSNASLVTDGAIVAPLAGTLKNFYLRQFETLNGTAGQTIVYTIMVNGSATSIVITATVGDTASTKSDTTHTASISAGDLINLRVVSGAITSNTGRISAANIEFDPS